MMYESSSSSPPCTCCYERFHIPTTNNNFAHSTEMIPNGITMKSFCPSVPKKRSGRRSKHIPHHLRPRHLVEKRNTRERRRVQDVNQAFYQLQALLPVDPHETKYDSSSQATRLSKVRTLRKAVEYILALQHLLNDFS